MASGFRVTAGGSFAGVTLMCTVAVAVAPAGSRTV
ncbi:MAG: DUF3789 domain-containing protein [Methylococcaceae bacterium]|nr:DUF3789 domain-containing protein [Methylococcaceae bacterium]